MAFKVVIISCLVALVRAGNIPAAVVAQPVVAAPALARLEELDFPQYSYGYNVADSLTGDYKSQQETRNGDLVQGRYSLLEADGSTRVVDYTADSVNGFNAVVSKNPVIAEAVVAEAGPVVTAARYVSPVAAPVAPVAARIAAAPLAAPVAPVLPARYTAALPPLSPYAAFPSPYARFTYPAPAAPIVAV